MYYVIDEENAQVELEKAMSSLETSNQATYYVIDDEKCFVELREILDNIEVSTESASAVGLTLTIDGIECYGLNGMVSKTTYASGRVEYSGSGRSIFVDKNHDLSYYFAGSDYVNEDESNWEINIANKYGYEWGGWGTATGVHTTDVGSGLSNTNSLIAKNLRPYESGWYVVWDKIKEFRADHSDQWFLPSRDELYLIYEAKNNLNNLSLLDKTLYWSSSEHSGSTRERHYARTLFLDDKTHGYNQKNGHEVRSRLCVQY